MVDKEKLLYRRQYFIGPRPFEGEGRWNTIKISNKHILSYHSDLNLVISSISNKKIILLGNIIDSKNPILTDEEIISSLLKKSKNADDVFEYLADTCGRYVIILLWDEDFRIFSDSCGLRQIFYHIDEDKNVWCASQPHLIGRNLKLKIDNKKKEDFIKTPLFRGDNYWFPGKITLFDRVFHLLPNHYIDLNLASTRRYWPRRILPKREVSEAIKSASEILTNIIEGAYLRYDLAFSISCGWDSRILLSVCRKVADKIRYITLAPTSGSNQDPDVYITRRMLNNLKLKHFIINRPKNIDKEFKKNMDKNIFMARNPTTINAQAIYEQFRGEKDIYVINGNCSEITRRNRFRHTLAMPLINGSLLAITNGFNNSCYAKNEFSEWLKNVKKFKRYNVDVMELAHWEHKDGSWAAMSFSEYEMVFESICPFSCRRYIEIAMGVPIKYRIMPAYKFYRAIIERNWPELLEYEINPYKNRTEKMFNEFLCYTNMYDITKYIYVMLWNRLRLRFK